VLVDGFPSGSFAANCFVLAPGAGAACVVIDPGQDAEEQLEQRLRKHRLTPVAVLLTHGHFDHTFSVAPVCDGHDIPAWIHPDDRYMLADPMRGISPAAFGLFGGRLELREPREVRELTDGIELQIAGLRLTVDHTPGHTGGSVVFSLETGPDTEQVRLLFAGDTLFAGSIGRTDLPGGDYQQIMESLRTKLLPLPDDTVVLPGHGPATTIGRERASNPFLRGLSPDQDPTTDDAQLPRRKGL
jgi:hydroxyacylglutathione hydrolase